MTFPSSGSGKSWSRTRTGSPFGRHSRPCRAYGPTCSFFLASTLTTGSPAAMNAFAVPLMYRNWPSRSGCCFPSIVAALPCVLYPSWRSSRATASFRHRCPCRASSPARFTSDFVVHFSGEPGSPMVLSSSSSSSAAVNPGSLSSSFLRPPPGRRARPGASAPSPSSSSACDTPAATVSSDTPAARATAAIPPYPSARASVPRYTRH